MLYYSLINLISNVWNEIPESVVESVNKKKFKKNIDKWMNEFKKCYR